MRITLLLNLFFTAASAIEVIQNGGFELNGGGDPGLDHWNKRGCQMSAEQWDVHQGEHSAHVSRRQAEWAGPEQVLDVDLLSGYSSAKFSFAIKLHAGESFDYAWTVQLKNGAGDLSYLHLLDRSISGGEGWRDESTVVDLPQFDGIQEVRLYLEGSPASAEPLVDSVSLVVGDDSGTTPDPGTWQGEANQRIKELRQSDLTITVKGIEAEATVELTMLRHNFPFGTALNANLIKKCVNQDSDDAYCSFARDNFNFVVLENAMKWESIEPERGNFRFEGPDATLGWAAERGMRARGHCLFWAVPHHQTPAWVEALHGNNLVEAVEEHINSMFDHFGAKLESWDVNNEMLHGSFFTDQSNDAHIRKKMFQWAHDKDPQMVLFVNDYNIIAGNEVNKYVALIQGLLDEGTPISGIGVQGHFGGQTINIAKVQGIIETLGQFGLPIWVTEFDWSGNSNEHREHAVQLENFYRLMFSLPQVEGVIMWGFWDSAHWRPQAAIAEGESVTPNEAGEAYIRLLHQEWSSSGLLSVEGGVASQRVFQGDYTARVLVGGEVVATTEFSVGKDDADVVVEVD